VENQGANILKCDNDKHWSFYRLRYKCVKYKFYTATEIMMVKTNLKKVKNRPEMKYLYLS